MVKLGIATNGGPLSRISVFFAFVYILDSTFPCSISIGAELHDIRNMESMEHVEANTLLWMFKIFSLVIELSCYSVLGDQSSESYLSNQLPFQKEISSIP